MQLLLKGGEKKVARHPLMTRLRPEQRREIGKAVRKGVNKSFLAVVYCVSLVTIYFWSKQDLRTNLSDIPRNHFSKITVEVEIMILYLRTTFYWGTARIQQGLINLPEFMKKEMEVCVQSFLISRTAINNVLKEHKLNGYRRKNKNKVWKFFRAKYPNELWQLDLKGPFKVEGEKYWALVCIDDYSRYLVYFHIFNHCPNIEEIEELMILPIKRYKPKKILTDNNPFGKNWGAWCVEQETEALFAHPYYPQDKGKVERAIRNLTEELIDLFIKFPHWLNHTIEFQEWYNTKRYSHGVEDFPANLFIGLS